jgi:hypothetical protein
MGGVWGSAPVWGAAKATGVNSLSSKAVNKN